MTFPPVKLDEIAGNPIVRGRLTIDGPADPRLAVPEEHQFLSIGLQTDPPLAWAGISVRPVVAMRETANGFQVPSFAGAGIVLGGLTAALLDKMPEMNRKPQTISRGGEWSGLVFAAPEGPEIGRLARYEVRTLYGPEGVQLLATGEIAGNGAEFSVDALLDWDTLTILGMECAAPRWKWARQANNWVPWPDRARDPRKLSDLMLRSGLSWPIVRASLIFEPDFPGHRDTRHLGPIDHLIVHAEGAHLSFSDTYDVVAFDNGYVGSSASNYYVNFRGMGLFHLEKALEAADSMVKHLAGAELGWLNFPTGYGSEFGDPLGNIRQTFKELWFRAAFGDAGLEIEARVTLDDFDPALVAEHRREGNRPPEPCRGFTLHTVLPWALLRVRDFRNARVTREIARG